MTAGEEWRFAEIWEEHVGGGVALPAVGVNGGVGR